jgi:hypothetical protein
MIERRAGFMLLHLRTCPQGLKAPDLLLSSFCVTREQLAEKACFGC